MMTITQLTFVEVYKKRILIVVLIMTLAFLALYATALHFAMPDLEKSSAIIRLSIRNQILNMGFYASSLIVACLSIFSSAGLISTEIENGTIDSLVSKPISRLKIILGKYLGVFLMLSLYTIFIFSSVVGLNAFYGNGLPGVSFLSLIKSLGTYLLLPALLSAIGIFLSTFLPTMGASIALVILYFIGTIGGMIEMMSAVVTGPAQRTMGQIGIFISLIIPSDLIYRKATRLIHSNDVIGNLSLESLSGANMEPSLLMMFYIIAYILFMLYKAGKRFATRDF